MERGPTRKFSLFRTMAMYVVLSVLSLMTVAAQPPHPKEITVIDPLFGEYTREYFEFIPTNYKSEAGPYPLIIDLHGWGGNGYGQVDKNSLWDQVGEEFDLIVVGPDGTTDSDRGTHTWNVTVEYSEFGWACDPDRTKYGPAKECHYSCADWCDPDYGCVSGVTCYDDVAFIEQLVAKIMEDYNIDQNHIHVTGISNGGEFTWRMFTYSQLNIAAIGPVAGNPTLGSGAAAFPPRSVIDFHGLDDPVIPRQYDHSLGEGPKGLVKTITAHNGFYFYYKPDYLDYLATEYKCSQEWRNYPTLMDGVDNWACYIKDNCINQVQIVRCEGNYGHSYPFRDEAETVRVEAARLMWDFFSQNPYRPQI